MTEWRPPEVRIRAVPHLGAEILHARMQLASLDPRGRGHSRRLWLRMRRLLPPVYWNAWFDVPRAYRTPLGVLGPAVQDYNGLITRLHSVADALRHREGQVTVAQAALWCCLRPSIDPDTVASEITDWHRIDPTGAGWAGAAAGLTPDEYGRLLTKSEPDLDSFHGLMALRGHRFPHPTQVPTVPGRLANSA